jgi:formylglycine-generating enzyme required for sulfatase activity
MSDIFLSYKSEDRIKAQTIAEALESHGYSVWWDRIILPGQTFEDVIEEELSAANCIVVLWSKESVKSAWVRTEATEGKSRKILVPVSIEDVTLPLAFRHIQAAKLMDWDGTLHHHEFDLLIQSVGRILGQAPPKDSPRTEHVKVHTEKKTVTNSIGMKFTLIPAGEFMMGSEDFDWSKPVHTVNIRTPFYLGIYQVTQREWKAIMGNNPSEFNGDDLPVEKVSWNEVQDFIKKLNEKEGTNKYRLPTEAEWEYSARAGTTTRYSFGDDDSKLGEYTWYRENSEDKTHPVGKKGANPWGLYDVHGNVWEWVQDEWHYAYDSAPADGSAWEDGVGASLVFRGGGWFDYAGGCQSASRAFFVQGVRARDLGFRLLQEI